MTNIPQTFIDDIHGKDILINEILKLNLKELYENKNLIDTYKLFIGEIYNCFTKIKYSSLDKIFDEKEYVISIIKYINNDKILINKMIERIVNEIGKSKESINFCENIFHKNSFQTNDGFISIFFF